MRGRLHLEGEDRVVELRGRVVQHSDTRFSWNVHLTSYEGWRGRLRIDGDGQYDLTVIGPYLETAANGASPAPTRLADVLVEPARHSHRRPPTGSRRCGCQDRAHASHSSRGRDPRDTHTDDESADVVPDSTLTDTWRTIARTIVLWAMLRDRQLYEEPAPPLTRVA